MARSNRDYLIAAGAAAEAARVLRRGWGARMTSRLSSVALRRGMRSGSRGWLYLAAGMQALRLFERLLAPKPEVFSIKLQPGESIEIREVPRGK
ncbi:MAG TPA: hypothetical protein VEP49_20950 [Acidimicrobiia bacterium]|nr:hypothetical protein [Acidimicrobiia bacterium]